MGDTPTLGGRGGVRAPGSADFSAPKAVPARWASRQQQRALGIFSSPPSRGTCRSPASPPRRRYRRDAPWERGTPPIPLPPTAPVLDVNPVPLTGHGVHDAIRDVRHAPVVQAGSPRVVEIRADLFSREADQVAEEHAVWGPLADLHLDPPVRHAPPNLPNLRDAYRHASRAAARPLAPPVPRSRLLERSVTTPPYDTTVSRTLRRPLRRGGRGIWSKQYTFVR
jgi:hypothetical protein